MDNEKELEALVGETLKQTRNGIVISNNELEKTLTRMMNFIDYCKFTFGEGITTV